MRFDAPHPYPPPTFCPPCASPVIAYDRAQAPQHARYACGTTTLMLWNDAHVDRHAAPPARSEALAAWKRRVDDDGGTDPALMLDPFDPDAARAVLRATLDKYPNEWDITTPPIPRTAPRKAPA